MMEDTDSIRILFEQLSLEQVAKYEPDGSEIRVGKQILDISGNLKKLLGEYRNLTNVHVIPKVDAEEIKVTNPDERGKGFINEHYIRLLFARNTVYPPGCGYFVFHGHRFTTERLERGNKTVYHDALGLSYRNDAEVRGFEREHDFVLLHPRRGIIFAEVKGWSNLQNENGFMKTFNQCKKQCDDGFTCMKAYVKHLMKLKFPSGYVNSMLQSKVDSLFDSFTRLLVFPSLSKEILNVPCVAELVSSLGKNYRILFMEDREVPHRMIETIETDCFVNVPEQYYSLIYEMSLSCCVFVKKGMKRMDFTPAERSSTRSKHLESMERIFLDHKQTVIRECREKILFVEGIAGSGKTLICLAKIFDTAQKYPEQSVLYLCYNKTLADKVRSLVEQRNKDENEETGMVSYYNIEVYNLMSWFDKLCGKTPQRNPPRVQENYYNDELRKDWRLREQLRGKYKNVFIDEYQDLAPNTRALLQDLFMSRFQVNPNAEGSFCVFFDNLQRVTYLQEGIQDRELVVVPMNIPLRSLSTVYRTPHSVAQNFMKYAANRNYDMGHEFFGHPIKVDHVTGRGNKQELLDQLLVKTVEDLKLYHGLADDEIAILYNSTKQRTKHSKKHKKLVRGRYSVFQFKGLESKAVIYYDPPVVQKAKEIDHRVGQHYTAGSRALWMYILLVKSLQHKNRLEEIMNQGVYALVSPARSMEMKRRASGESNDTEAKKPKKS